MINKMVCLILSCILVLSLFSCTTSDAEKQIVQTPDNVTFVSVSAGTSHTAAIDTDGGLWVFGANNEGQLGVGTKEDSYAPVKIMDGVVKVSAGDLNTMAIKKDGTLWAWGNNKYGQLGNGTRNKYKFDYAQFVNVLISDKGKTKPAKIMDKAASVSVGMSHALAVKTDGSLWAWGSNSDGQLGNGAAEDSNKPVKIMDGVAFASAGKRYSVAIKTDGSLWAWGNNSDGQLGNGTTESSKVPVKIMDNVSSVAASANHTAAVKTDGSLWTWGYRIIDHDVALYQSEPKQIADDIISVSASDFNIVAVKTDGSLLEWSAQQNGQMMLDDVINASTGGFNYHVMAVKKDGSLWAWGYNKSGQFGEGTTEDSNKPIRVGPGIPSVFERGYAIAKVSVAGTYSMAITTEGSLYGWGENNHGQLGDGTTEDRRLPVKLMDDVESVSAGASFTSAVKTDGSLWVWGFGQNGDDKTALSPSKIMEDTALASDDKAVKKDGSLWVWTYDHETRKFRTIMIMENVSFVAQDMVIKTDGSLWQLDIDSKTLGLITSEKVMDDVAMVSNGEDFTVALKKDGSLWTWGENDRAQLGNGTMESSDIPTKIMDDVNFITAGGFTAMAIKTDGSLWTWGLTSFLSRFVYMTNVVYYLKTPEEIKSMENIAYIATGDGYHHTLAVKKDGSLWAWGFNYHGGLGIDEARFKGGFNIMQLYTEQVGYGVTRVAVGEKPAN